MSDLTLGEWREKWSTNNRPEGKSWYCQWIGFIDHCSEASVMIHPERHRNCGWQNQLKRGGFSE